MVAVGPSKLSLFALIFFDLIQAENRASYQNDCELIEYGGKVHQSILTVATTANKDKMNEQEFIMASRTL